MVRGSSFSPKRTSRQWVQCARKRGGGPDDDPASGGNAPASGISEPETAVVNPGVENTARLDIEDNTSDDEVEPDPRRDLRAEAISTRHLPTHQPKNRYCKACTRCKMQGTPCGRGASSSYGTKPEKFGDICTCDHIIAYDELSKGINGEQEALVLPRAPDIDITRLRLKWTGFQDTLEILKSRKIQYRTLEILKSSGFQ